VIVNPEPGVSVNFASVTSYAPKLVTETSYVTVPPLATVATNGVFTTFKSAKGVGVVSTFFVTVDELLPDDGSVIPAGGATVAVFDTVCPAVFTTLTTAVTVKEYVWPLVSTGSANPASDCRASTEGGSEH
jgi:hypothetical protein